MFCEVKVIVVCAMALVVVYIYDSKLEPAVVPAIAKEPKEFTEDCIITLEIENKLFCIPAGIPSLSMLLSSSAYILRSLRNSLQALSIRIRASP